MKKTKYIFTAIIIFSLGILAIAAGYYFYHKNKKEEVAGLKQEVSTLNWKTYSDAKYGFQFIYPNRWLLNQSQTGKSIVLSPEVAEGQGNQEKGIIVEVKENANSFSSYDWILQNLDSSAYQKRTLKSCEYNQIPCSEIGQFQEKYARLVVFAKENSVIVFSIIDNESLAFGEKILQSISFTQAASSQDKTYVIKQGETLAVIAAKFNLSWQKLARYNKISSPDSIYAGQKIKIPADPSSIPSSTVGSSVDYDLAKVYQERVDQGREVWRLDPLEVAKREIPPQKKITAEDQFQIVSEDKQQGQVQIQITTKSNSSFLATLVQPIRNGVDGIWVVKSVVSK